MNDMYGNVWYALITIHYYLSTRVSSLWVGRLSNLLHPHDFIILTLGWQGKTAFSELAIFILLKLLQLFTFDNLRKTRTFSLRCLLIFLIKNFDHIFIKAVSLPWLFCVYPSAMMRNESQEIVRKNASFPFPSSTINHRATCNLYNMAYTKNKVSSFEVQHLLKIRRWKINEKNSINL